MTEVLKEDRISVGGSDGSCTKLVLLPLLLCMMRILTSHLPAPKSGVSLEF